MSLESVNIVWFKRDLRLVDHEPLDLAVSTGKPLVLMYVFEPSVMAYDDSDVRHWRFVYQSLQDMQKQLDTVGGSIYIFHKEVPQVFEFLFTQVKIDTVFSSEEIGNKCTFDRDLLMKALFDQHQITWKESRTGGVVRKLKSRDRWDTLWKQTMLSPVFQTDLKQINWFRLNEANFENQRGEEISEELKTPLVQFQIGGTTTGVRYLQSFLKERYYNYSRHISKPLLSRKGCSRISPYLAMEI